MKPFKQFFREYFESEVITLYRYLQMNDREKGADLANTFPEYVTEFLDDEDLRDKLDLHFDREEYEIVEELFIKYPKHFDAFADWLMKKSRNGALWNKYPAAGLPSWFFLEEPEILRNQWLVHFTRDAAGIVRNGFRIGVADYTRLGLTTHFSNKSSMKSGGGFNFGYTVKDFPKYAKDGHGDYAYGNEVVVFRASGVRAWHNADSEHQAIFLGRTANSIIRIYGEDGEWRAEGRVSGRTLYQHAELQKVIDWVVANYDQYRKQL